MSSDTSFFNDNTRTSPKMGAPVKQTMNEIIIRRAHEHALFVHQEWIIKEYKNRFGEENVDIEMIEKDYVELMEILKARKDKVL